MPDKKRFKNPAILQQRQQIADTLKKLRKLYKLHINSLASLLNMAPISYRRIETAKSSIYAEDILRLCKLYDISLEDFFNMAMSANVDIHKLSHISDINMPAVFSAEQILWPQGVVQCATAP